jgi:hypothetical protein
VPHAKTSNIANTKVNPDIVRTQMEKQSSLEKVTGSVAAQSALAALAASVATPLAALLPVLANSIAAERHRQRVETALADIDEQLQASAEIVRSLTDDQFKFLNEIVLAVLQTTEDEKLRYLKRAISNGISRDAELSYSAQLSRILRDISATELRFVTEHFQYERIVFDAKPDSDKELRVNGASAAGVAVTGLIALGLLVPASSTMDDTGKYRFSPLVAKLIILVRDQR